MKGTIAFLILFSCSQIITARICFPPVCPLENSFFYTVLLPADDCRQFYACNWGTPILMNCGKGTAFNPVVGVCDHIRNVDCSPCTNDFIDGRWDLESTTEHSSDDSGEYFPTTEASHIERGTESEEWYDKAAQASRETSESETEEQQTSEPYDFPSSAR